MAHEHWSLIVVIVVVNVTMQVIDAHCSSADKIVVHCMFSQQRGPRCATRLCSRLSERGILQPSVFVLQGGWMGFVRHYRAEEDLVEDVQSWKAWNSGFYGMCSLAVYFTWHRGISKGRLQSSDNIMALHYKIDYAQLCTPCCMVHLECMVNICNSGDSLQRCLSGAQALHSTAIESTAATDTHMSEVRRFQCKIAWCIIFTRQARTGMHKCKNA